MINKTITTQSFVQQLKSHFPKLLKYGSVGASAALLDFGIFVFLLWVLTTYSTGENILFFSPVTIANTTAIVSGFLWSFILQKYWAFNAKGNTWLQLIATSLLMACNIVITNYAIPLIAVSANISLEAAKFIMQITVVSWNYIIYNYFIFKHVGDKE